MGGAGGAPGDLRDAAAAHETAPDDTSGYTDPLAIESGNQARVPGATDRGVAAHEGAQEQPARAGRGLDSGVRINIAVEPAGQAQELREMGDQASEDGNDGSLLPQCYSSPAADPSEGAWAKCVGGEKACSPTRTTRGNWAAHWGTDFGRYVS